MSLRTCIEPVLTTVEKYLSFSGSLLSFLAALLVLVSTIIGLSAVRTWTNEKRKNATRIMISVLEARRAIKRIRNNYLSDGEYRVAKKDLRVSDNDNPAVIGQIALNRAKGEMKYIDELQSYSSISSVVFGPKIQKEIEGIIFVIDRIIVNAETLKKTAYGSRNASNLFETLKESSSDDEINKIVDRHVEVIRKNIKRYLPPNT